MDSSKRMILDEQSAGVVSGGAEGETRLYFVDRFGGGQEAGPFLSVAEAQAAQQALSRREPDATFVITYTVS